VNGRGIRQKVLLVSLLPTALLALSLVGYFTVSQIESMEESLENRGNTIVRQLAPAVEYGIVSGSADILRPLAESTLELADVRAVVVTDRNGEVLVSAEKSPARAGARHHKATAAGTDNTELREFHARVLQTEWVVDDYLDSQLALMHAQQVGATGAGRVIGSVVVKMDTSGMHSARQELVSNSILLIITGLLFSGMLAYGLGHRVTRPIMSLTDAVRDVEAGNFEVDPGVKSRDELEQLSKGISAMALTLKLNHEELEQRVHEATRNYREAIRVVEDQNDKLEEARRQAEAASRTKSLFLANMSHEIRSPMTGITGFLQLLGKTQLDVGQLDYLRTINISAESLLRIIDDILDMSKIEAGKLRIEQVDFDLRQVLEDVLVLLAPEAREKGLELTYAVSADMPPRLTGDPGRIKQVLTNLVSNAVKFTHEGEIRINCTVNPGHGDDLNVGISVTDTGIGIPEAEQRSVFDIFTQTDNGTAKVYRGTGLGLSISTSLVELMGGEIGLESAPGQGSRFWFALPMKQPAGESAEPAVNGLLQGLQVMVFSPSDALRRYLVDQLAASGGSAHAFGDVDDALAGLAAATSRGQPYVVAVLDTAHDNELLERIMAGLTGERQRPALPVILLEDTAGPFAPDILRNRATAILRKPLRASVLVDTLLAARGGPAVVAGEAVPAPALMRKDRLGVGGRLRVLVADDNEINRRFLVALLSRTGVVADEADNGVDAITLWEKNRYDMILMDVHMPGIDGRAAAARMCALEGERDHTPIIAVTADVFHKADTDRDNTCFDDYLHKPVTEEQLAGLLAKWTPGKVSVMTPCGKSATAPPAGAHPASSYPVLDMECGLQYVAGKRDILENSLNILAGLLMEQLAELRRNLEAGDIQAAYELAHKLKGSASYCGALRLQQSATRLESACHARDRQEAGRVFVELEQHAHELLDLLQSRGDADKPPE
jgi:two-component system sensor histidine kinase BarA